MKRIALIFILILTFNAVFSQAKIGTDGSVEPTGNFPAMKDEFLKGSMRVVADTTARNAIPSVFRKNGMLVYDQALKTLWVLDSSVSPIWKNYLANATVDSTTYATRARLYKVADSLASVNAATYQPIGSYLTLADSATFSTKAWRQKGVDSVQANLTAGLALKLNISDTSSMLSPYYRTALANATIVQRITDSLRSLVRLRASGSGGIQLQNSVGTNVADFGIANTTNGSIAGGWNVGGNLAVTGTSGFTGKATFSDSIVGVNQRLTGVFQANTGSFVANNQGQLLLRGYSSITGAGSINNGLLLLGNNTLFQGRIDYDGNSIGRLYLVNTYDDNASSIWFRLRTAGTSIDPLKIEGDNRVIATNLQVTGALTATAQGNNIAVGVDSSVTSTSYTLVLGDAGYLKRCDNASAITITVPTNASVAFPIGTQIFFSQKNTGKVNLSAASGVNLRSEGNLLGTAGQHAVIGILKVNTNDWLVIGNRG